MSHESDWVSFSTTPSWAESDNGNPYEPQETQCIVPDNIPGLNCTGKVFNIHPYSPLMRQVDGPAFIKFMGQEQANWNAEATGILRTESLDVKFPKERRQKTISERILESAQKNDLSPSPPKIKPKVTLDWGLTDTQGHRMDPGTTRKVVDVNCAFTAAKVSVSDEIDGLSMTSTEKRSHEAKQERARWCEWQREKRYVEQMGKEILAGYARQEKERADKAAAELAAKRATLPPKKVILESAFTLFSNLPTELRLQIWREVLKEQRIARVYLGIGRSSHGKPIQVFKALTPPPSILHTCREARGIALKYMRPMMATRYSGPCIYMIPHIDRLYVDLRCNEDVIAFESLIVPSDRRKIQILQMPIQAWMDVGEELFANLIYNCKKLQFVVLECAEGDEIDTDEELWTGFPACAKVIKDTLMYKKKQDPKWKMPGTKIVKIEEGKRREPLELMKKEYNGVRWMYWDPEDQPKLVNLKPPKRR